jgi:hypothetical protein
MSATSTHRRYEESLRQAVERLRDEGWEVQIQPPEGPAGLERFKPDYVARRGDELIVGEIKFRGESDLGELEQLTRLVNSIPGARVEMIWLGRPAEEPQAADIVKMAGAAKELSAENSTSALLLAWAALDGAIAAYTLTHEREHLPYAKKGARQKLNEMANLGELSESQFERLDNAGRIRNSIAHGEYIEPPLEMIEYVSAVAVALVRDRFSSIEGMIEWFFENYKDPAEVVPFSGRDGGYQYVSGGPFDAEDVISGQFDLMPPEDVSEAVQQIESQGIEWVRIDDY